MFIDEAKILARLKHPNVIRTLEYGITGKHRYIAMELLSGRTYSDIWDLLRHRKESLPLRLGAYVCARVAEGLHHAHELCDAKGAPLNVIHRDVNPTNIFLTHEGLVKLIDFGLAKARMRRFQSAAGIVKGKIPYLAPEQARGEAIDRRCDVYSLGATLWETCTMQRLFKRDTDVETLRAIRDANVPDIREMIEGFPDALWYIIEKSLQRNADDRYATAAAMQRDLDAFVSDGAAMREELAKAVSHLFPGQEEEQAEWARAATDVRVPKGTLPPPAPVPIASSTMLEDVPHHADPEERGPPSTISSPPAPSVTPKKTSPSQPALPERASTRPRKDVVMLRKSIPPADPPTDRDESKRLVVSVLVVLAILAAIAAAFAFR